MSIDNNFEYGKTYYIDKTGIPIDECEATQIHLRHTPVVESRYTVKLPQGFQFENAFPCMSFDLSKLSCVKSPVVEKVTIDTHDCSKPLECEVVLGYEIRVVGGVNFSFSSPIEPRQGFSFPCPTHACCTNTVPVNMVISHTCCPKPCVPENDCFDWTYAYFCVREACYRSGSFLKITMGLALEYIGSCECDDE